METYLQTFVTLHTAHCTFHANSKVICIYRWVQRHHHRSEHHHFQQQHDQRYPQQPSDSVRETCLMDYEMEFNLCVSDICRVAHLKLIPTPSISMDAVLLLRPSYATTPPSPTIPRSTGTPASLRVAAVNRGKQTRGKLSIILSLSQRPHGRLLCRHHWTQVQLGMD